MTCAPGGWGGGGGSGNPPTNIVSQVSGPVVRATSPGVYVIIGVSPAMKIEA